MRLKDNGKADLIILDSELVCFKLKKNYIPSLRNLHKYPWIMPKMQVDKGGIKFILNGSNVMCPGLTSEGGHLDDVEENREVPYQQAEGGHSLWRMRRSRFRDDRGLLGHRLVWLQQVANIH